MTSVFMNLPTLLFCTVLQLALLNASEDGPRPLLTTNGVLARCQLVKADNQLKTKNAIVAKLASVMVYASDTRRAKDKDGNEIVFPVNQEALIFRVQGIGRGDFKGVCYVIEVIEENRPDQVSPWEKGREYTLMSDGDFWDVSSVVYVAPNPQ